MLASRKATRSRRSTFDTGVQTLTSDSNSASSFKPSLLKHHATTSQPDEATQMRLLANAQVWVNNADTVTNDHSHDGFDNASHSYMHPDPDTLEYSVDDGGNQLQLWVYETSNASITIAERLEKANWEAERLERL